MPKFTVYIETSVISYFVARHNRNVLTTAYQQTTRRWWAEYLPTCGPCISSAVENEIRAGDPAMAAKRLVAIDRSPSPGFPRCPLTIQ